MSFLVNYLRYSNECCVHTATQLGTTAGKWANCNQYSAEECTKNSCKWTCGIDWATNAYKRFNQQKIDQIDLKGHASMSNSNSLIIHKYETFRNCVVLCCCICFS